MKVLLTEYAILDEPLSTEEKDFLQNVSRFEVIVTGDVGGALANLAARFFATAGKPLYFRFAKVFALVITILNRRFLGHEVPLFSQRLGLEKGAMPEMVGCVRHLRQLSNWDIIIIKISIDRIYRY